MNPLFRPFYKLLIAATILYTFPVQAIVQFNHEGRLVQILEGREVALNPQDINDHLSNNYQIGNPKFLRQCEELNDFLVSVGALSRVSVPHFTNLYRFVKFHSSQSDLNQITQKDVENYKANISPINNFLFLSSENKILFYNKLTNTWSDVDPQRVTENEQLNDEYTKFSLRYLPRIQKSINDHLSSNSNCALPTEAPPQNSPITVNREILEGGQSFSYLREVKSDQSPIGLKIRECLDPLIEGYLRDNSDLIVYGGKAIIQIPENSNQTSSDWDLEYHREANAEADPRTDERLLNYVESNAVKHCKDILKTVSEPISIKLIRDHYGSGMSHLILEYENSPHRKNVVDFANIKHTWENPEKVKIAGINYQNPFDAVDDLVDLVTNNIDRKTDKRKARLDMLKALFADGSKEQIHPDIVKYYQGKHAVYISALKESQEILQNLAKKLHVNVHFETRKSKY